MDDEERFERLLEVLAELREANESMPIVVEGQRDVTSLRLLGMPGDVLPLHTGAPLFTLAEDIGRRAREVVLLTDWDDKGQALFEGFGAMLVANGVRVERTFRDRIRLGMRPTLKDVESLASYVGKNLARFQRKDLDEAWR